MVWPCTGFTARSDSSNEEHGIVMPSSGICEFEMQSTPPRFHGESKRESENSQSVQHVKIGDPKILSGHDY
jgi:hypothetical protein